MCTVGFVYRDRLALNTMGNYDTICSGIGEISEDGLVLTGASVWAGVLACIEYD